MVTGGCDDSSGDTRLARGLPFGSMPLGHPSHPMLEGSVQREGEEMARATRRPGGGQQRSVAPAGDAQRSESSSTWTSGSRRTKMSGVKDTNPRSRGLNVPAVFWG